MFILAQQILNYLLLIEKWQYNRWNSMIVNKIRWYKFLQKKRKKGMSEINYIAIVYLCTQYSFYFSS